MPAKLYKIIFDISVCFTIGAFLLSYFGSITIYGGSYLTLLAAVLVTALMDQKRRLRILTAILLPAVAPVIHMPGLPELVIYGLIWAYYAYVTITDRLFISRGEFVDWLKRPMYLSIGLIFPILIAFHKFSAAMQAAAPYLIVAIVSAVFLLRHLRAVHQAEQMKRYKRQQLLELLAFLAISLLLTLVRAPQNLMEGLKQLYLHVIGPILSFLVSVLGMLLYGVINLMIAIFRLITHNQEIEQIEFKFGEQANQSIEIPDTSTTGMAWLMPFLYAAGAILGTVLLFFFFRWLMGERFRQSLPAGIQETREYMEDRKEKRSSSPIRKPKDPGASVRYYFGKYMLWLQHKHVPLEPADTTEEINQKYMTMQKEPHEMNREAAAQLKQIYRKARYQLSTEITGKEAEKAKELYRKIKN